MPNDGEILTLLLPSSVYRVEQLPLFSLEYRLEQSDKVNTLIGEVNEEYPFWRPLRDEKYPDEDEEHHHEDSTGFLDGTRQDILNVESNVESENYDDKSKERIVLPSSVSRVVKDDAVMKNKEVIYDSNLNVVADAKDDVDNAKSQFECENSIGSLDRIRYEYYLHNNSQT